MTNKLALSNDKMVLGVAAGIAAHTGMDATLIRLLFVLFTLAGGSRTDCLLGDGINNAHRRANQRHYY